ncbi:MAG: hypothetical protein AAF517_08375 [Planctomycetota bacterium]
MNPRKTESSKRSLGRFLAAAVTVVALLVGRSLEACSVCFGDPESPTTIGANLAIIFLLVVTGAVLVGFASFIVYLKRREQNFAQDMWGDSGQ